ncbi:MAG: DoxX family membrane protein [Bacteroidetes bacterium]|jgi:putative oxidoreductase|nr:DoxX family membrane protein [Bacteroidota bacterium]
MKAIEFYEKSRDKLNQLKDIPLLFVRLILAYGFYEPTKMKWSNIAGIAEWFGSMNYPFPLLNAYLAATTEALGVVLLLLGLGTRIISIPLMITMLVAIFTVHLGNGFAAGDNGFEIPLYYLLMLLVLLTQGAGKISVDALIDRKRS